VGGVLAVVAILSSCSTSSDKRAASGSGMAQATTTTSSPASTTTTVVESATTAAPRQGSTPPASSPEGYAKALYDAWTKGDRAAAAKVAQPDAVDALFARQWKAGDGWSFVDCSGAAGSVICTWDQPGGGQLLFRVQNVTGGVPVTVSEIKFQS
jgi:hypothetical protein